MKKVVVDRYIIVVGVMNVTRQSSSKNMNEHCLSNMDMSTMFRIQMGRAGELVFSVTLLGLLSGKFIFRKHLINIIQGVSAGICHTSGERTLD